MQLHCHTVTSPLGDLRLLYNDETLYALSFAEKRDSIESDIRRRIPSLSVLAGHEPTGITTLLKRYFEGDHHALQHIKVKTVGSSFQLRTWSQLRQIKSGEQLSYGQLSQLIGSPTESKALAAALETNPVAIIVPCHRVTCSHGNSVRYSGGLERKVWLNKHERVATDSRDEIIQSKLVSGRQVPDRLVQAA